MKAEVLTGIYDRWVIHAISKKPQLLAKLLELEEIWHPEWKHFSVVKANAIYVLFEYGNVVFHSPCYEVVLNSLIERMHFHQLERKNQISKAKTH